MINNMMRATPLAVLLGCAVNLAGCGAEFRELSRVSNPTGTVDAVVTQQETAATVVTPTEIYLLPKGGTVSGDPAFRADHVTGLKVVWDGSLSLKVHADQANILSQSARVDVYVVGPGSQWVSVVYGVGR